jgi:hypothetical protein
MTCYHHAFITAIPPPPPPSYVAGGYETGDDNRNDVNRDNFPINATLKW